VLFPFILVPLVMGTLGVSWFLSSVGVFLRDIAHITGVATTILLFVSPVFFPVSALPVAYQPWLYVNPLTPIIEASRDVLVFSKMFEIQTLAISYFTGALFAWGGFWWFQKTRKGFADVI